MSKIWSGRTELPPAVTIEPPAHRLICSRGTFSDASASAPKAKKKRGQYHIARIVDEHPFNRRVRVLGAS